MNLQAQLVNVLETAPGLRAALLFGSQARGTARADSDVDVALLFERRIDATLKLDLMRILGDACDRPVDIVDLYDAPEPILGTVLAGQRLVGKPGAFTRLTLRHVTNGEDFVPLQQRLLDERRNARMSEFPANKLAALRRCLDRLEQRMPPNVQALQSDWDAQDIVALNLMRAVQICVDLGMHLFSKSADRPAPVSMRSVFTTLEAAGVLSARVTETMCAGIGFRNVAVHAYDEIDWAIVFAICTLHLDDFRGFAREVAKHAGL